MKKEDLMNIIQGLLIGLFLVIFSYILVINKNNKKKSIQDIINERDSLKHSLELIKERNLSNE